jgi:hypothetical protein
VLIVKGGLVVEEEVHVEGRSAMMEWEGGVVLREEERV